MCIVLHQFEVVAAANVEQLLVARQSSVQVHRHDAPCARCDGLFHAVGVKFQMVPSRFHQYRFEIVACNSQYGGNVGVSRHDDFVAICHHPHLLVGAQYEVKRIKSVGHRHTMLCADVAGIVVFKLFRFVALQKPPRVNHAGHGGLVLIGVFVGDALQVV